MIYGKSTTSEEPINTIQWPVSSPAGLDDGARDGRLDEGLWTVTNAGNRGMDFTFFADAAMDNAMGGIGFEEDLGAGLMEVVE